MDERMIDLIAQEVARQLRQSGKVLLPDSGYRIGKLITSPEVNKVEVRDLPEAVSAAAKLAERRVILCPAAASYGFYKNFEERGKHFKQLVEGLK